MVKHTVIGLMSGTSLDGLDVSAVEFIKNDNSWSFKFIKNKTITYSDRIILKLKNATQLNGEELSLLNIELGQYFGKATKLFINENDLKIDLVASHGHTVFHQPENNLTLQIGSGQEISNATQLPVVFDFRSKDVSFGGHGAPLVPIGDDLLFANFDACINFGGIANVSYKNKLDQRVAFDICPFNMPLNFLAGQLGYKFDESGQIAKSGKLDEKLLNELNQLEYYKIKGPKSLGVEWFESHFLTILNESKSCVENKLHTVAYHIAFQISNLINGLDGEEILISGGGVYNTFIIELIKSTTKKHIVVPPKSVIDFKEALIFAFLGVLKWNNEINVLKSVTGASKNTSSGQIILP